MAEGNITGGTKAPTESAARNAAVARVSRFSAAQREARQDLTEKNAKFGSSPGHRGYLQHAVESKT